MVDYCVGHSKLLKAFLAEEDNDLEAFNLKAQEWRCAKQLRSVLKATMLFFSRDETPNLASVIPAMDRLDRELATACVDEGLEPAIRAAANLAKKTLNWYYSLTDASETYRIAMVLHPRYKLNYFRTAGWTDKWIKAAELVTRATYAEKYQSCDIPPPTDVSDGADNELSSVRHPLACNACLTYAPLDVWLRQYL
ncbi:hypothetical protein K525DRAFT_215035 [Schizophyllum commune Loenen D]|nr:hypothetical protein K525DRAFT_215035 [Schizophyllum commune Loenen D]